MNIPEAIRRVQRVMKQRLVGLNMGEERVVHGWLIGLQAPGSDSKECEAQQWSQADEGEK